MSAFSFSFKSSISEATKYLTTYYGQLAHLKIKPDDKFELSEQQKITDEYREYFYKKDLVKIVLLEAPSGPPPAHFNFAVKGIVDITYGVHNYTAGRFTSTQITELPFLSKSSEILSVAWQRIYQRELLSLEEHKGTHLLGVYTHGPGQLWLNKKYTTLESIKGLKIRIGGGIAQSSAKALGLVPLQAPVTKAYELLSGGVADGMQLPAESISFFKLDRLIKQGFFFEGGLYNTSMFLVINKILNENKN